MISFLCGKYMEDMCTPANQDAETVVEAPYIAEALGALGAHTFAGDLNQFKTGIGANSQSMPIEVQDHLITAIAEGRAADPSSGAYEASQIARMQLGDAFALSVIHITYRRCRAVSREPQFIEEVLQAGMAALMGSIDSYARLPQERRHALWPYLERAIGIRVGAAIRDELLGIAITGNSGPETRYIGRYMTIHRNFVQANNGRQPSNEEMAALLTKDAATSVTVEEVCAIRAWTQRPSALSVLSESAALPMRQETQSQQTQILVERALEFLGGQSAENRKEMMRLRFGFEGEALGASEIAERLGLNDTSVSAAFTRDSAILREVITGLRRGTVDYDGLRKRFSVRNVLGILHYMDKPIPPDARLPELRELADRHLRQIFEDENTYRVLGLLYGTDPSGGRLLQPAVAQELGISKSGVSFIENRALDYLAALRSSKAA